MNINKKIISVCLILGHLFLLRHSILANNTEIKIRPGDEININVVGYDDLQGQFVIKLDGTLTLPLIGNIKATDFTIEELTETVTQEYWKYLLTKPQIIITRTFKVSVLGGVQSPGSFKISGTEKISDLISMAGGLTESAKMDKVKITRHNKVIISNFEEVVKKGKTASDIGIQSGDIIYIPKSWWSKISTRNVLLSLSILATSILIITRI